MITKAAVFVVVLLATLNCINAVKEEAVSIRGAADEESTEVVPQTVKMEKKKIMRREKKGTDPEVSLVVESDRGSVDAQVSGTDDSTSEDASSVDEQVVEESDMATQMQAVQEQMQALQEQMAAMQEQQQELQVVSAHRVNGTEGYLPCANTDGGVKDKFNDVCWDYHQLYTKKACGKFDVDGFRAKEMCCFCGGGLREANHHWNVRPTVWNPPDVTDVCPGGKPNTNLGGTTVKFYSNIATSWQCAQKCWYSRTATHFVYGTAAPRLKKCWCKTGVSTKRTFAGVMAGTPCERCSDMAPINGDVGPNLNLDGSTIHVSTGLANEVACSNLCKGLHRPATHYVFQASSNNKCWCKGKQNSGQSPVTRSFARAGVNSGKLC